MAYWRAQLYVASLFAIVGVVLCHQNQTNVSGWSVAYGNMDNKSHIVESNTSALVTRICVQCISQEITAIQAKFSDNSLSQMYGDSMNTPDTYECMASLSCITGVKLGVHMCATCTKWRITHLQFMSRSGNNESRDLGFDVGTTYEVQSANGHCLSKMEVRLEDVGVLSFGYYRLIGIKFYFDATASPTHMPTVSPTLYPSLDPTVFPTYMPTRLPTNSPTVDPTSQTGYPTSGPTEVPTTVLPTNIPTGSPVIILSSTSSPDATEYSTTDVSTSEPNSSTTVATPITETNITDMASTKSKGKAYLQERSTTHYVLRIVLDVSILLMILIGGVLVCRCSSRKKSVSVLQTNLLELQMAE